jgi:hypothetical protein
MTFLQQQSEYMAAYNAQEQQEMNMSVLFILNTVVYLSYNWYIIFATVLVSRAGTAKTIRFPSISVVDASVGITCSPAPPQVLQFCLGLWFVLTFQILTKLHFVGIRGYGPQHATTGDTSTRRSICRGGSYYMRC